MMHAPVEAVKNTNTAMEKPSEESTMTFPENRMPVCLNRSIHYREILLTLFRAFNKVVFTILLLSCFASPSSAQTDSLPCNKDGDSMGKVTYHHPGWLDSLLHRRIEQNKKEDTYSGYRIQIYFGAHRKKANKIKGKFLEEYPGIPAYLVYQQPYFKIRVGNFHNKLEAQKLYYELVPKFKSVLIVPDKVHFDKD